MKKILVVEDSPVVTKVIKHVMGQVERIQPLYAASFAEAKAIVQAEGEGIFAALIDLNLPDAPSGEVVDFTLRQNLPTVVLTGSFDAARRRQLLAQGVVDYVVKEGRYSYVYAAELLRRLVRNESLQVLVVDDSAIGRQCVSRLLSLQRYQVLEARDGVEAIRCLVENPGINLMITDFHMPRMDGCELIRAVRGKYEKADLVIIGLSSTEDETLSAQFIKSGANDFLRKPFNHEEFFCRISHNMDMLEILGKLRDARNRDIHTGTYNHYYFFDEGQKLLDKSLAKGAPVAAAIIALDDGKAVYETYGRASGEQVARAVAQVLQRLCERFLLAHAEGQQFYLLMVGLDAAKACAFVERVRQIVVGQNYGPDDVAVSFSAGVADTGTGNLEQLIQTAGQALARAQEAGGDLVIGDDEPVDQ